VIGLLSWRFLLGDTSYFHGVDVLVVAGGNFLETKILRREEDS
jgi:hypothetical protein